MKRRDFDPWHIDHIETPAHAGYDAAVAAMSRVGALTGCIYAVTGKRGTGKTQAATLLCAHYLSGALKRQAESQARRYAIIRQASEKGRTTTKEEWEVVKALQVNLMPEERWPLYTSAQKLFLAIKESWESSRESIVTARYLEADILVVDEAHVRNDTKWEDDHLSDLIDRRCYRNRDTLIMSNLDAAAFAASLGASIVSRIRERGAFIECNWPSFRDKK